MLGYCYWQFRAGLAHPTEVDWGRWNDRLGMFGLVNVDNDPFKFHMSFFINVIYGDQSVSIDYI